MNIEIQIKMYMEENEQVSFWRESEYLYSFISVNVVALFPNFYKPLEFEGTNYFEKQ